VILIHLMRGFSNATIHALVLDLFTLQYGAMHSELLLRLLSKHGLGAVKTVGSDVDIANASRVQPKAIVMSKPIYGDW
jgi:hypothetical protein